MVVKIEIIVKYMNTSISDDSSISIKFYLLTEMNRTVDR